MKYPPKQKYLERMRLLLKDEEDLNNYLKTIETTCPKAIRVNTLKIKPERLKSKLEAKGWKISKPIPNHPEIIQVNSELQPGELGKTTEHLLGYYYVQEITSMMPIIALNPQPEDLLLDTCSSPGSKTSQAASLMNNRGTIIANDINPARVRVLSANLERCGATNSIVTRHPGSELAEKLNKMKMKFNKILIDAPCSGEGNIRCSPRTLLEWSEGLLKNLAKNQKRILSSTIPLLKPEGEIIYSTCTHSPEENELVINQVLNQFPELKIIPMKLPVKTRPGITQWDNKKLHPDLKHAARIYPQDENLEGFFLCKMRLE
jgi:NOL1/NOP2/sun family putative RNA methylase